MKFFLSKVYNTLVCISSCSQLRDWNEELQSARELPKETMQQRLLRDRAIFKVTGRLLAMLKMQCSTKETTKNRRGELGHCLELTVLFP